MKSFHMSVFHKLQPCFLKNRMVHSSKSVAALMSLTILFLGSPFYIQISWISGSKEHYMLNGCLASFFRVCSKWQLLYPSLNSKLYLGTQLMMLFWHRMSCLSELMKVYRILLSWTLNKPTLRLSLLRDIIPI